MLQWAHEHGCLVDVSTILRIAASSGHIKVITWVKQQPGVVYDYRIMAIAAEKGHIAMCEYLHAEQCPWNESVYYTAARSGHVGTVRWLQEHGCPRDATKVCQVAAMGGSIDFLMYVQQQGMRPTPAMLRSMLNIAAVSDKLAAAQWIRQQGAEWPAVLKYNGKKWAGKVLAWARSEGCTSPTQ
jgi:hypothetical protein